VKHSLPNVLACTKTVEKIQMSSSNRTWSSTATAAFGSRDTRGPRQAAEAAYQVREQREAQLKRVEDAKEAQRVAEATNFASTDAYPSLGGKVTAAKAVPTMNFSKTVVTMAARAVVEEKEAAAARATAAFEATLVPVPSVTRHRFPQEPAYVDDSYLSDEEDYEGGDGQSDGEYNADLGSTRRRGDKGIW